MWCDWAEATGFQEVAQGGGFEVRGEGGEVEDSRAGRFGFGFLLVGFGGDGVVGGGGSGEVWRVVDCREGGGR